MPFPPIYLLHALVLAGAIVWNILAARAAPSRARSAAHVATVGLAAAALALALWGLVVGATAFRLSIVLGFMLAQYVIAYNIHAWVTWRERAAPDEIVEVLEKERLDP